MHTRRTARAQGRRQRQPGLTLTSHDGISSCEARHTPPPADDVPPSARQSLQFGLCAGQARAMHSVPQNLATRHPEHFLSLRRAPQPKQHATATSREHAIRSHAALIAALCSEVRAPACAAASR